MSLAGERVAERSFNQLVVPNQTRIGELNLLRVDWSCFFVCFQASGKNLNLNDESQHGLLMQLLKLSYNCLNYDFIGTSTDESSDDLCTVQIPTSWRSGSCRERGDGLFRLNSTISYHLNPSVTV